MAQHLPNYGVPLSIGEADAFAEAMANIQRLSSLMNGVLIEKIDPLTGDPDLQVTKDAEDDFARTGLSNAYAAEDGPGCRASDPAEPDHDTQGDTSRTEWHSRGRRKDDRGVVMVEELGR